MDQAGAASCPALTYWASTLSSILETNFCSARGRRVIASSCELLYDGEGDAGARFVMGLSDAQSHAYDDRRSARGASPAASAN